MENNENKQKKKRLLALLLLLIALLLGGGLLWKCNRWTPTTPNPDPSPVNGEGSPITQHLTPNNQHPHRAYAQKKRERMKVVEQAVKEEPTVQTVEETPVTKEVEKPVTREERKVVEQDEPEIDQEEDVAVVDTAEIIRPSFPESHFRFGPRLGIGYTSITRLGGILESYNVRPHFDMTEKGYVVPRIGLFGEWRYKRLGIELGADYTMFSSTLTKYTPQTDVRETVKFRYDILYTQLLGNVYLTPNIYMGAGVSVAFPFVSRNIDYSTNRNTFYQQVDNLTRYHLRNSLKKRPQLLPTIHAGYQLDNGIQFGLEYSYGITDLMETLPNDYSYNEIKNNTHFVSFTVAYNIFCNRKKK